MPPLPSRPFGSNPLRLRACGAALASRGSPAGYPRRAQLGAPRCRRTGCAGWPGRWRTRWSLLRQVVRIRAVLNAGGSCPSRHEGRFTDNPPGIAMALPQHAYRPAPHGAAGAFSPVVGWLTWPASGASRCSLRAGIPSRPCLLSDGGWFGPRRPCVVVNPGGGTAAPRASWLQPSGENNFPCFVTAFGAFLAGQIVVASRCSTALRPQAVQPARPRRPDHNKDAMGANLVQP